MNRAFSDDTDLFQKSFGVIYRYFRLTVMIRVSCNDAVNTGPSRGWATCASPRNGRRPFPLSASGRKKSVSGVYASPKTPFYRKLMSREKACNAMLPFEGAKPRSFHGKHRRAAACFTPFGLHRRAAARSLSGMHRRAAALRLYIRRRRHARRRGAAESRFRYQFPAVKRAFPVYTLHRKRLFTGN